MGISEEAFGAIKRLGPVGGNQWLYEWQLIHDYSQIVVLKNRQVNESEAADWRSEVVSYRWECCKSALSTAELAALALAGSGYPPPDPPEGDNSASDGLGSQGNAIPDAN